MSYCNDCPLRPDGKGVCISPPERQDRLKMLAASQVPVQCHKDPDVEEATRLLNDGKDWRLDATVTSPCYGTTLESQVAK